MSSFLESVEKIIAESEVVFNDVIEFSFIEPIVYDVDGNIVEFSKLQKKYESYVDRISISKSQCGYEFTFNITGMDLPPSVNRINVIFSSLAFMNLTNDKMNELNQLFYRCFRYAIDTTDREMISSEINEDVDDPYDDTDEDFEELDELDQEILELEDQIFDIVSELEEIRQILFDDDSSNENVFEAVAKTPAELMKKKRNALKKRKELIHKIGASEYNKRKRKAVVYKKHHKAQLTRAAVKHAKSGAGKRSARLAQRRQDMSH